MKFTNMFFLVFFVTIVDFLNLIIQVRKKILVKMVNFMGLITQTAMISSTKIFREMALMIGNPQLWIWHP
jgi:uncharacterized membrane protein YcgQ (UPF0703/DUF1980 family)